MHIFENIKIKTIRKRVKFLTREQNIRMSIGFCKSMGNKNQDSKHPNNAETKKFYGQTCLSSSLL